MKDCKVCGFRRAIRQGRCDPCRQFLRTHGRDRGPAEVVISYERSLDKAARTLEGPFPLSQLERHTTKSRGGCWQWLGAVDTAGYGMVRSGKEVRRVHRIAFEVFVGPLEEGMHIDHICSNKACWNPNHLEQVTPAENTYRARDAAQAV